MPAPLPDPLSRLADDYAEVRAEMARLRLREAQLRAQILAGPGMAQGKWFRVEVERRQEARFDPALLPLALREDPAFHSLRETAVLHCSAVPLAATLLRPGWPIRRMAAGLH